MRTNDEGVRGSTDAISSSTRAGSQVLRDLRSLHVCVFHPHDRDGELLMQQLQRIGCQVHCFWPPLDTPVPGSDLVFIGLYPDTITYDFAWCDADDAPSVVAVVNYENPTIIDAVLRVGAKAIVAAPVRSFGVLSALVLARQISGDLKKLNKRIARLEERVYGARKIAEAQEILMRQHGISKPEAYKAIRDQAMGKRVSVEEIASAIVAADEILSIGR
ncbi:ANTAR domain-containing protein [Paraburkholderia agricolaris]|jgi:AmiR/NasT family two-component response regulator|uniref:ANTAR domain-containing protein n=1 Tax=Paraburkholderia agricolaris TaxID=2152888 RepID=A0ABW8ZWL0_9BURK|nr:ANTAR domain-containing protein [Paraburkholderia fungorum]